MLAGGERAPNSGAAWESPASLMRRLGRDTSSTLGSMLGLERRHEQGQGQPRALFWMRFSRFLRSAKISCPSPPFTLSGLKDTVPVTAQVSDACEGSAKKSCARQELVGRKKRAPARWAGQSHGQESRLTVQSL